MTDREVQELFVHHPFAEAKRLLIEECERNGHELQGHENVFELKALATQGAKGSMNSNVSQQAVAVNGGGNGEPTSQQGEGQGQGQGQQGQQGQGQQNKPDPNGTQEDPNGAPKEDPNGEPDPKTKKRRKRKAEAEANKNQQSQQQEGGEQNKPEGDGGEDPNQQPKEPTPEEKEAEANKKIEEAKKLLKEAEEQREEQRKKEEEERKKREEQAAKNNRHHNLDEVVRRIKCLHKAFLVGPAGTGKSTLAMAACKELFNIEGSIEDVVKSDKFAQISFSPDTVSADMLGFTDVNGVFHETDIIRVFREGGLILFDEMDDADASLLVKLNTMLANRVIPTPSGVVTQHPDCYIVGTANTYGTGGNSMYVGRSRLDAATLDRWKMATIYIDYDTKLEAGICNAKLDPKQANEVITVAKTIRELIGSNKWKQICSTRFVIDCCNMMAAGYKINNCIDTFLLSWEENNRRMVKSQCKEALKSCTLL